MGHNKKCKNEKKRLQWGIFFLLSPGRAGLPLRTAEAATAHAMALGTAAAKRVKMLGSSAATAGDTHTGRHSRRWHAAGVTSTRWATESRRKRADKCIISGSAWISELAEHPWGAPWNPYIWGQVHEFRRATLRWIFVELKMFVFEKWNRKNEFVAVFRGSRAARSLLN